MIYDTVKWCWTCQKPKPRDEVLPVRPGSKRSACKQCREKIEEAESKVGHTT